MKQLTIEQDQNLNLDEFEIKIIKYLGLFNTDTYYFKVQIINSKELDLKNQQGLLRISHVQSNLEKEIELRNSLTNYGMISELLTYQTIDNLIISLPTQENKSSTLINKTKDSTTSSDSEITETEVKDDSEEIEEDSEYLAEEVEEEEIEEDSEYLAEEVEEEEVEEEEIEEDSEYLAEEYYPELEFQLENNSEKLLVLTNYPETENTLTEWLTKKHTDLEYLSVAVQICQCLSYLSQRGWYCLDLLPELITIGTPIKIFDLTHIYHQKTELKTGLLGKYSAPELAYETEINQLMSTYVIGALLYEFFSGKIPNSEALTFDTFPPRIQQIIRVTLSLIAEERYTLEQLLQLLIETRNELRKKTISWKIAHQSTLGLSLKRLVNEDSYGFKLQEINQNTILLAGIADGMGGLAEGELASNLAIKTLLETPLDFTTNRIEKQQDWLLEVFKQANKNINQEVKDGGTTLSVILAIDNQLIISHVGDSRIYLLRKQELMQLSEDHSLVNMLVASGQITVEESKEHPDRNVLLKSLGSKSTLSSGYVQTLTKTINVSSLLLEDNDLLILCSDGVWDLVNETELLELFTKNNLEEAVNQIIKIILDRGASDNATIMTCKCSIKPYKF